MVSGDGDGDPGRSPNSHSASPDALRAELLAYCDGVVRTLDRVIGTYLFNAALDLHTALATTNPQDVDAGVYAALQRLDEAIIEIRTATHRQGQFHPAASGK